MFFTEVKIERNPGAIRHGDKIWSIGSCFADEIGRRMADALFDIRVNPCGTLYNPFSIANALTRIASGTPYTGADIFLHNGLWHCMDFHSSFSRADASEALAAINGAITALHAELSQLQLLMVTFGSARAFIDNATCTPAGNCHKLPASRFHVRDFAAGEIVDTFTEAINLLRRTAPDLRVIYTVSPIRHKSYGFHADRISKANLLIAADELCRRDTASLYFPAYEIMNDELRDYRFYAADMIHPSEVAADHICQRFLHSQCDDTTISLAEECIRLTRRIGHRPINAYTPEAEAFRRATTEKAARLCREHPELSEALHRYDKATKH